MDFDLPDIEKQDELLAWGETTLRKMVNDHFPKDDEANKSFRLMVKKLLPVLKETPASPGIKYHSAWAGGLLAHTVAVMEAALRTADALKDLNDIPDDKFPGFCKSIVKTGFLHDIGKVGNLKNPYYRRQENDWRRDNLGEMFEINRDTVELPYLPIPQRSIWIAQQFGVDLTEHEMQAIVASDGPGSTLGKQVISTFLEEPLTMVIHFADKWVSQVRGI